MTEAPMIVHDPAFASVEPHGKYPTWSEVPALPHQSLLDTVGAGTLENFYLVGEAWAHVLHHRLAPGATALDIGCGCGRTARFLLFREDIAYIGFDIFEPAIAWCNRYLAPFAKGRFRFEHFDAHSGHYNPRGRLKATEVRFPAADASIDVAFAASLFTHLLEDDARHYLRESARILKPTGVLVASVHCDPEPGKKYSGRENRIEVEQAHFLSMARSAGLAMAEDLGSLCGQETLVFKRS
jgi:SAM-dependent methyltransferase